MNSVLFQSLKTQGKPLEAHLTEMPQ